MPQQPFSSIFIKQGAKMRQEAEDDWDADNVIDFTGKRMGGQGFDFFKKAWNDFNDEKFMDTVDAKGFGFARYNSNTNAKKATDIPKMDVQEIDTTTVGYDASSLKKKQSIKLPKGEIYGGPSKDEESYINLEEEVEDEYEDEIEDSAERLAALGSSVSVQGFQQYDEDTESTNTKDTNPKSAATRATKATKATKEKQGGGGGEAIEEVSSDEEKDKGYVSSSASEEDEETKDRGIGSAKSPSGFKYNTHKERLEEFYPGIRKGDAREKAMSYQKLTSDQKRFLVRYSATGGAQAKLSSDMTNNYLANSEDIRKEHDYMASLIDAHDKKTHPGIENYGITLSDLAKELPLLSTGRVLSLSSEGRDMLYKSYKGELSDAEETISKLTAHDLDVFLDMLRQSKKTTTGEKTVAEYLKKEEEAEKDDVEITEEHFNGLCPTLNKNLWDLMVINDDYT